MVNRQKILEGYYWMEQYTCFEVEIPLVQMEYGPEEVVSLVEAIWAGPHWEFGPWVVEMLKGTVELENAGEVR